MKVLVSRFSSTGSIGGAEMSALLHCHVLNKIGHSAAILTNFEDPKQRHERMIIRHLFGSKIFNQLFMLIYAPYLVFRHQADIVNPHSRYDQIGFTLTKWLHRTPVIWKDPGDLAFQIKTSRRKLLARLNQAILVRAARKADAIYTLNVEERHSLIKKFKSLGKPLEETKIFTVPSDILFEDYNLKAKPIKKTDKLVIGTVVQLHEHKGVQYLIEAFERMNYENAELWVVGDGPFKESLEQIAGSNKRIKFFGYQPKVSAYLRSFDIFVQPAEIEGWGRTVKEAMYFSLPIIGSRVGGIKVQIDDSKNGLLFEPKNSKQLQKLTEKLLKDKKLRTKFGKAAHKSVVEAGDFKDLLKNRILPIFRTAL